MIIRNRIQLKLHLKQFVGHPISNAFQASLLEQLVILFSRFFFSNTDKASYGTVGHPISNVVKASLKTVGNRISKNCSQIQLKHMKLPTSIAVQASLNTVGHPKPKNVLNFTRKTWSCIILQNR